MVFRGDTAGEHRGHRLLHTTRANGTQTAQQRQDGLHLRPSRLCLAVALVLSGQQALAQEAQRPSPDQEEPSVLNVADADAPHTLDAVEVVGTAEQEKKAIGNTSGASKEDVERRKASHVTDLLDQISGVSANNLYAAPETSVKVQGIAGHGRVSQSLEGVTQNFHGFTRDIGQTGSIFVNPQLLKSIDVTRGGRIGTGTLGSLGGSVDFKYLDLDDILRPGKNFGGMIRGSTGFGKYRNGEKPSGSLFLGGRNERWEVMIGATQSENEEYRIGSSFNRADMLRDAISQNIQWGSPLNSGIDPYSGVTCRYCVGGLGGMGSGMANRQFTEQQLNWLKQASDQPLKGTQRKSDAQMLRLRHYFNDVYNQELELFATANSAKYETDQQPSIFINESGEGTAAQWNETPWSIRAELESQVVGLKYSGNFSEWLNPTMQLYYESQDRKQRWLGYPGSFSVGKPLHYSVDVGSRGLKLNNASHFDSGLIGPLRLDAGLELRRADKKVDSLSDAELFTQHQHDLGNTSYRGVKWDPDSRTDTYGLALALSTEGEGPWKASAGVGYQRVRLDALNPAFAEGNVKQAGTYGGNQYYLIQYLQQGIPFSDALAMAAAAATQDNEEFLKDPTQGISSEVIKEGKQKHTFNLKSAHFGLQYSLANTGLTSYASINYSERAPTSNEMYMNGSWLKTGFTSNPYLKPEKNLSFQLGSNYTTDNFLVQSDQFFAGIGYYHHRIKNYIVYGPTTLIDQGYTASSNIRGNVVSNVNNLNDFIKHGLEINLAYRQPLFYVRGNLTVPFRKNNKICSWQSPHGRGYLVTPNLDGSQTITHQGQGDRLCYSSWNWMEAGAIDPIQGSLTAALTPYHGQLELGVTMHYRGKQRASFWYDRSLLTDAGKENDASSEATLPEADFITASLWPKSIKYDLFVNYRFSDQLRAGIYVANLTDRMDATTTTFGYNFYPGRTITANLEYKF